MKQKRNRDFNFQMEKNKEQYYHDMHTDLQFDATQAELLESISYCVYVGRLDVSVIPSFEVASISFERFSDDREEVTVVLHLLEEGIIKTQTTVKQFEVTDNTYASLRTKVFAVLGEWKFICLFELENMMCDAVRLFQHHCILPRLTGRPIFMCMVGKKLANIPHFMVLVQEVKYDSS